MRPARVLALSMAGAALGACAPAPPDNAAAPETDTVATDVHTYANYRAVRVDHLALDLTVDFDTRTLSGTAALALEGDSPRLVLDTRDLTIHTVLLDDGAPADYVLGPADPILGQALQIDLRPGTRAVTIGYTTSPDAAAVQWLGPAQTAGGERPFLFTQSQAILARTWVPCQDSPAVRFTYEATVRVPSGLMAVMSAENATTKNADGVYRFSMKQPIPSYLLALAVGDLEFRPLGERSGVYAEPSVVEAAAWEFADVEEMMVAAERLYGPYLWERYDLLVLPPSFPFGGMENPRLTFATPTILAGDRSLVSLVAHELAHSWSGNLVTNATWNDFWLNEGFTTYIENRLMEELYGADYAAMLAALGRQDLVATLEEMGESPDAHLLLDLEGRDPDDGMNDVAYEKGAAFLHTLEERFGRKRWDEFLRGYFDAHAFESIDTTAFVRYLRENLLDDESLAGTAAGLDVERWIGGSGLPSDAATAESDAFDRVDAELDAWTGGRPAVDLVVDGWTTHHWLRFLRQLPGDLEPAMMSDLDAAFGFTDSGNSEIQCAWLVRAIRHGYRKADPALERFLTTVGRRKFLRPLYRELAKTDEGLTRAKEIYAKARPGYHPISTGSIDQILGWEG